MSNKWANRVSLSIVVGGALLLTPAGLDRAVVLAGVEDALYVGIMISPGEGPIGTQSTPSASIVAPSAAIGDFGASRGNVWDMNSTDDIVAQQEKFPLEMRPELESGTVVRGYTPSGQDLAIGFYASGTNDLPSTQYHNLLYRLRIAAGPHASCATNGRVLYATRWPRWLGYQKHTRAYSPEDAPMYCDYGNFCVYYMDLSRNDNDGRFPYYNTWFADPSPWPTDGVKAFGMWPHETWYDCGSSDGEGPDYFDVDYVYLTGDIVAREKDSYTYTVKYNVSDPDRGSIDSTIRYQEMAELQLPANSPACNSSNFNSAWHDFSPVAQKTTDLSPSTSYPNKVYLPIVIGAGGGGGGSGGINETYTLNFSDDAKFTDGKSYYLCIKVDDGTSQSYTVSSAPVIRAPLSPNFGPN